jgi:hypothetical protein
VAKYIFEDEVRRGNERRSAAEARRRGSEDTGQASTVDLIAVTCGDN